VDGIVMKNVMDASRIFFDIDVESKMRSSSASANRDGGGGDGGGGSSTMGGYRGYFDIGAEDLENRDGTRDLAAEEEGGGRRTASSVSHDDDDDDDDDDSRNSTNGEVGRRQRRGGGDFKEGFDCGLEVDDDGGDDARVEFFGRNVWPDEVINPSLSGFRDALLRYQSELLSLSDRLLLALGRSLDHRDETSIVPEDYFVRRSRNPMCTLRLLHYPPGGDGSTGSTSLGCGAHTDYGLFTILMQDSIGGLQVRNRGGHWIDARPLKDSFVINVGDMLSRWTDGEYASTVHRVISPGGRGGRDHRYSVPFFFNPDHDAVVRPLRRRAGRRRLDDDEESDADGYDDGAHGYGRTALEILKDRYNGTFTKN
jgi:isopenicillin N synthase-like dioxygenase